MNQSPKREAPVSEPKSSPGTKDGAAARTAPKDPQKYAKITAFALLCIFFFIYAIYHIGNAFKEKTELFTATRETAENTADISGYIFRDETVLYGTGVSCSYNYKNGEKVAKNSAVAKSYYAENAEIRARLAELESKIDVLEASASVLHIDLEEVDKAIAELRTEIALKSAGGNMAFLEDAQKDLLVLLHKRALAEQNKNNYETELAALRTELSLVTASANNVSTDVISASAGYFYSYTDGLEASFTADAAKNITFESFAALTSAKPVKSSAAIGKVAAIGKWYFVCKMTILEAEEIVADKTYECSFTDNAYTEKLPMVAESKTVDYENGEVLLVFSCTHIPANFDFSRTQRAKITISEIEGLRVPSSSVRVENGQTIVYIIKEGVCRPRKINILFEKSGYCIVSMPSNSEFLAMYDRIIMGEKDLYDGKVIDY